MRQDLFRVFKDLKEVSNAFVLTYAIDFVFLQSIVIPALKLCGQPKLTVFADAYSCSDSYADQFAVLDSLGIRYRVVPVAPHPGFCFHPKAVFLSGPPKATLFVGSGNLTFGGWKENAEIWVRFDSDNDGTGPFFAFRDYLQDIVQLVPLHDRIRDEIVEAFDVGTRSWASSTEQPQGLIGKSAHGQSIIDQMAAIVGDDKVGCLTVCSPFFDEHAEAAMLLAQRLQSEKTRIFVQRGRSGLSRGSASVLLAQSGFEILPVDFEGSIHATPGDSASRFIHAKFYAIEQGDRVTIFVGSANCSRAALAIPGASGNFELLAVQVLDRRDFQERYLGELQILQGDPDLPEYQVDRDKPRTVPDSIQLLAARFEDGSLLLAYNCNHKTIIEKCLLDGIDSPVHVEVIGQGKAIVRTLSAPRSVILQGVFDGQPISSNPIWVDNEQQLSSTWRSRTFVTTVLSRVRDGQWHTGAWVEVMEALWKHLQYIPYRFASPRVYTESSNKRGLLAYSEADVFSADYGLPSVTLATITVKGESRVANMQRLLRRWFAVPLSEESAVPQEANSQALSGEPSDPDDPMEDMPKASPRMGPAEDFQRIVEQELIRAEKAIRQVSDAMTDVEYLQHRPPELMASDMKVAALLFCVGVNQRWITQEDFFEGTYRIWSSMFLSSAVDNSRGWLEYRFHIAECKEEFAAKIKSEDLAAALAAWSMAVPPSVRTPKYPRFLLASTLAVARLDWLWEAPNLSEISNDLAWFLKVTEKDFDPENPASWASVRGQWTKMIRRGKALQKLESVMARTSPAKLRDRIRQDKIAAGELLWQGHSGFYVAATNCRRSRDFKASVLPLQGKTGETQFRASFLIPVRSLLSEDVIPMSEEFRKEEREVLVDLTDELAYP